MSTRAKLPTRLRKPLPSARCDVITDLIRRLEPVPPAARWRVSWGVKHGQRERRLAQYLVTDEGARNWCERNGLVFPGDLLAPAPMSCAHDPDWGVARAPAPTGEAAPAFDVRGRAAGDHHEH